MMNTNLTKSNANKEQKLFQRYFNKAVQYQSQNEVDLAIELYGKALQYNNNHLPTLQVLAALLHQSEHYGKALHYYSLAVELHPHSSTLQNALGNCYEHCQQIQKAKEHYVNAIELRQDYAEALNNFGNICRKTGEYQQAEFSLLRSLRLCISVPTLINLGLLMTEMYNYAQAHSFYDHALRLQPFNNEIKWHKALLLLTEGEFKQGWELYTSSDRASMNLNGNLSNSSQTIEKQEFFKNKVIYIKGKQSINDEVMFASCIQEIIKQSKKCYIECDDRLVSLFQRSFCGADIIPKSENKLSHQVNKVQNIDVNISMVDIARALRQSFSDFPSQNNYLTPSIEASQRWKKRYDQQNNDLKIGIAWRSSASDEASNNCCSLKNWNVIFTDVECQLVNLQYGQVQADLDLFERKILDWPETDHQHNIEQLAAQISALDLVITTNNLVAHLAGALGKPVWIILPYAANWRWFNGKNPCPWYSSARMFKQKVPGDWVGLFQEINQHILALQNEELETSDQIISAS